MNCKDCYHYDVCEFWKALGNIERVFIDGGCKQFKDISQIVELPCKISDTLYHYNIEIKKQGRKKVIETIIEPVMIDRFIIGEAGVPQVEVCNDNNEWVIYSAEDFGKTVFLTREEAEKARAEHDKTRP